MRGLFTELVQPSVGIGAVANMNDERYWNPMLASMASTGIRVTPDLAFGCSCLFQGVRLISETVGILPVKVLRELDDESTEPARDNPLWGLLRDEPNDFQTGQEFREIMTARAILWGSAIAEIIPGPRGAVDQVIPIHPDSIAWGEQMNRPDGNAGGRLRWGIRQPDGTERVLVQDQVFRLPGFGTHAFMPPGLLTVAREAIGLWLALEKFESTFFLQGARPGFVLEAPGKVTKETAAMMREQLAERVEGLTRMHRPFISPEGMKLNTYGFNLRDSQATESRAFMVQEMARWLNLPEYKLGGGKQPTFASVEQFAQDYVDTTIMPWVKRWEGSAKRDLLVVERDRVYVKLVVDALLRGNTTDRASAYSVFVTNGIFTRNEIRRMEDRNPLPGLDEPLTPLNMDKGGNPNGPRAPQGKLAPAPQSPPPDSEDDTDEEARTRRLRIDARTARLAWAANAAKLVRREISTVKKHAPRLAADREGWRAWVGEFYAEYAGSIAETLQLAPSIVRLYVERHQAALLTQHNGATFETVLTAWSEGGALELLKIAAGEGTHV